MLNNLPIIKNKFLIFLLFSLLLTVTGYLLTVKSAHAQACTTKPTTVQDTVDNLNRCAIEKNVFDDKIFNVNQITGTTDSLYMLLTGSSQLHPQTNQVTMGTGALAATGKLVTAMYSAPPVSGVQYFAHELQKFNPVKDAYAQNGIGYDALQPVQRIWEALRNISYVGFIIVFVVIGFMIMFRSRISPQAVATVQDSLPRIVIALILVTFSYAIAGLMIDIMFLFLNVVISALKGAGVLNDNANAVFTKSVFGVVWGSWKNTFGAVATALKDVIDGIINLPLGLDNVIGFLGGTIGAIVVGIAMLFIMFRVFFMLLVAYATIILLTMAAPFFFLFQALPGNNGAKEWFKQMAANVSIFPVTALMFIFAGILGNIASLGGTGTGQLTGDQIGQFPLLAGDINSTAVGKLIAIGFLLMTPNAADMVKKAIGAQGGASGMAGGAMAGLAAGAAVAGAGAKRGYQSAQEHLPQQIGPQGSIAGKFKYINPAYYRANSQVAQERRTENIRHEAGSSIKDKLSESKPTGGGKPPA